jgi:hypothetical protein
MEKGLKGVFIAHGDALEQESDGLGIGMVRGSHWWWLRYKKK